MAIWRNHDHVLKNKLAFSIARLNREVNAEKCYNDYYNNIILNFLKLCL